MGLTAGGGGHHRITGQQRRLPRTEHSGRRRESLTMTLRHTDMQVLWLATVTHHLGVGMQQVLLGWVVLALTDSESMVGAVFAIRSAPNLVVGFAAGTLTDRCDRRRLMRLAAFGKAGVSLVVAWLAYTELLTVRDLLLCTGALGMWQALEMTARQAYVVDTLGVHRAVQGIALISLAQRFGGVIGSLIAGATLTWLGVAAAFLVMGTSFGIGACLLYALRHQGIAAPRGREPIRQSLVTYLRALRTNLDVRSLMISTAAAELFGFSHQVMLPILAKQVLHVGADGLGLLTAFRFLGGVLGVGSLAMLSGIQRRGRMLLVVLAFFGGGQVVLACAPAFWFAAVCVIFINIMAAATDVLHQTLLQGSVANELRGRAMGSWIIGTGIAPIGHLEVG
ncbi:MAG TPA: MFS transporter, partial [Candidatus Tectomicrobia bacterium]|nr:MFS transporter [Candidatus Tectomicrobia bacterium]